MDKNGRDSTLSQTDRTLIQKFQSLLGARCGTNGRNLARQVLKVALRVRKGLVPLSAGGTVPMRDF